MRDQDYHDTGKVHKAGQTTESIKTVLDLINETYPDKTVNL